jgi:hypothetical protein
MLITVAPASRISLSNNDQAYCTVIYERLRRGFEGNLPVGLPMVLTAVLSAALINDLAS